MANDPDDEELSGKVHVAVRDLILEHFKQSASTERHCAILSGVAGALVEFLWLGRKDGYGVRETRRTWKLLGNSFIDQAPEVYPADQRYDLN